MEENEEGRIEVRIEGRFEMKEVLTINTRSIIDTRRTKTLININLTKITSKSNITGTSEVTRLSKEYVAQHNI